LIFLQHVGDEKIATLETYFKDDDMVDFVSAGWGRKVASWTGPQIGPSTEGCI
jgi:hypothetical protein